MVDKYNAEGYPDPTASEALKNVLREEKRYKPCVFICSPFSSDIEGNLKKARAYMRFAVEQGMVPFAPHLLYPQVLDDTDCSERELGLLLGLIWLEKCDELWVFGRYVSTGMEREIAKAKRRGMPVRYFTEQGKEVGE